MNNPHSIQDLQPELVTIRQHLHAHPDLSFEEERTAEFVAQYLRGCGIPVETGIGGYGVVASLKKGAATRSIALRADMDALPMQEMNDFPHASKFDGKMHACGHDGHTAMLLGAARALSGDVDFDGTVHFVFQPAEERGAGAKRMIEEGLFERFKIDAIYGVHNWPGMAAGTFGVRPGAIMASSSTFEVRITGKGAHAAQPQRSVDPVMTAVSVAQSWQSILSRNLDPLSSAVLSVTQISSGTAHNVIPAEATLAGSVRAFDEKVLNMIEERMEVMARNVAHAYGAEVHFRFHRLLPTLLNTAAEIALATTAMLAAVGAERVNAMVEPSMASEDFAFFLQHKPGCYAFLGNGLIPENGTPVTGCSHMLHSPIYDFNDEILSAGVSYWVSLVKTALMNV